MRHSAKPKKKMMTAGTAVFACYSAACAPPSAGGTGGSIAGKGGKGGGSGRSRTGLAGRLEKQMGASGGGNVVRAQGVRDDFRDRAASARTAQSAKFFEAASEGAKAMLHSTVTQAYAMKQIKEARVMKRTASDLDRQNYHDGWAYGAEKAAQARWG